MGTAIIPGMSPPPRSVEDESISIEARLRAVRPTGEAERVEAPRLKYPVEQRDDLLVPVLFRPELQDVSLTTVLSDSSSTVRADFQSDRLPGASEGAARATGTDETELAPPRHQHDPRMEGGGGLVGGGELHREADPAPFDIKQGLAGSLSHVIAFEARQLWQAQDDDDARALESLQTAERVSEERARRLAAARLDDKDHEKNVEAPSGLPADAPQGAAVEMQEQPVPMPKRPTPEANTTNVEDRKSVSAGVTYRFTRWGESHSVNVQRVSGPEGLTGYELQPSSSLVDSRLRQSLADAPERTRLAGDAPEAPGLPESARDDGEDGADA